MVCQANASSVRVGRAILMSKKQNSSINCLEIKKHSLKLLLDQKSDQNWNCKSTSKEKENTATIQNLWNMAVLRGKNIALNAFFSFSRYLL